MDAEELFAQAEQMKKEYEELITDFEDRIADLEEQLGDVSLSRDDAVARVEQLEEILDDIKHIIR